MHKIVAALLLLLTCATLSSCGTSGCFYVNLGVSPASATADHLAASPGNQASFAVGYPYVPPGCYLPVMPEATWTVSDPQNVKITPGKDGSSGIATCLHATGGPVTVTGSFQGDTATAQLTCQ